MAPYSELLFAMIQIFMRVREEARERMSTAAGQLDYFLLDGNV